MAARRSRWTAPLVVAIALAAGACGQGGERETPSQPGPDAGPSATQVDAAATTTTAPAEPPTQAELNRVAVKLDRIAGMPEPVALATAENDSVLYVGERAGRVRAIRDGKLDPDPVLDLRGGVPRRARPARGRADQGPARFSMSR